MAIANLYDYFQIDMFYSDRNFLVQINEFNLDLPSYSLPSERLDVAAQSAATLILGF